MSEGPSTEGCGVLSWGQLDPPFEAGGAGDKNWSDVGLHGGKADVTHAVQGIKGLLWFEACRGGRRF